MTGPRTSPPRRGIARPTTFTPRQLCDLELLLAGEFSPPTGFMTSRDHASDCADMRFGDGTLWPVSIVLDIGDALADTLFRWRPPRPARGRDLVRKNPSSELRSRARHRDINIRRIGYVASEIDALWSGSRSR